jgi:hypothetical protein
LSAGLARFFAGGLQESLLTCHLNKIFQLSGAQRLTEAVFESVPNCVGIRSPVELHQQEMLLLANLKICSALRVLDDVPAVAAKRRDPQIISADRTSCGQSRHGTHVLVGWFGARPSSQ